MPLTPTRTPNILCTALIVAIAAAIAACGKCVVFDSNLESLSDDVGHQSHETRVRAESDAMSPAEMKEAIVGYDEFVQRINDARKKKPAQ